MNNSDSLLWDIEKDPALRSTIVSVSMLDRAPDWVRLQRRLASVCDRVPRMRQRVAPMPLRLGTPRWQPDPFFDLNYHLRRIALPSTSDSHALFDLAAHEMMSAFDKDRPLWEFTLVEGLPNGRAALIKKVHHSFTDGVGAVNLAYLLFENRRVPRVRETAPTGNGGEHGASVLESMIEDARSTFNTSWHAAADLSGTYMRAIADPLAALTAAARGARSVAKLLAPVSTPMSPVMTDRGLTRWMDAFDVSKSGMLEAAHAVDCSLNDAFLAAIAGGLTRYHEMLGAPVDCLRVTMPINLRDRDDPSAGNRFTPARFTLPIGTADPGDRMRELGEIAQRSRREPALALTDTIAGVLSRLPTVATTAVFGSMLKGVDFVATNVPGLQAPAYLAGSQVLREYAFGPPSGAALSIALLSHIEHCCVGITIDTTAVSDPPALVSCVRAGFEEVVTMGGSR